MHGVPRDAESLRTDEEKALRAKKTMAYVKLKDDALDMHKRCQYDGAALSLSARLLELNPDFYTLFNWRKLMIDHQIAASPDRLAEISENELKLMELSLMKNPKSYYAWSHREWILKKGATNIQREMALVSKFLSMDSRNFHGWDYRRVVASYAINAGLITHVDEFLYTTNQINQNFSNYSAWHYRTVLIPRLLDMAHHHPNSVKVPDYDFKNPRQVLDKEFELVKNAFWTLPQDQSGWLYHRWLLSRVLAPGSSYHVLGVDDPRTSLPTPSQEATRDELQWQCAVFQREATNAAELLAEEPTCKWVILTHALLLVGLARFTRQLAAASINNGSSSSSSSSSTTTSSTPTSDATATSSISLDVSVSGVTCAVTSSFDRLITLDALRRQYYIDNRDSLLRHLVA